MKIAFNTANLVARVTNYRFRLHDWGKQHKVTVAATDAKAWSAICREIAATGFTAVEVWEAHASPDALDKKKALEWKKIMADNGLQPIGYAGGLREATAQMCSWLEIPAINGGLVNLSPSAATDLCLRFGIHFHVENHPEKQPRELLDKIGGGNEWLGVCIDTGWLGTQGVDAPSFIRECGSLVRHVHLKDVKAPGAHETCLLGSGSVDVAGCIQTLRDLAYHGWYSWEDEPEDRNPFLTAAQNREWILSQAKGR